MDRDGARRAAGPALGLIPALARRSLARRCPMRHGRRRCGARGSPTRSARGPSPSRSPASSPRNGQPSDRAGPGGRSGKGRGLRAGLRVRLVSGDLLGRGPTSAKTLGH